MTRIQIILILAIISCHLFHPFWSLAKETAQKSPHKKAELFWQQGQELYSQGKIKEALEKFKESYRLEPDDDKGSYIAWLISQLPYESNQDANIKSATKNHHCFITLVGNEEKIFTLNRDWTIAIADDGDVNFFKKSSPLYPNIRIMNETLQCDNKICRKKIFERFCKNFSKNFYVKASTNQTLGSLRAMTATLYPKKHKNIEAKFFLVPHNTKLYGLVIITKKGGITPRLIKITEQIAATLSEASRLRHNRLPCTRAPAQVQEIKREIEKLFSSS